MSIKIVVTDYEFTDLAPEQAVVAPTGLTLTAGQCKTEDELIALCADADGLINQYAPITARVIAALTNCKVISRYGVGLNTIDVAAATRAGICVANVPDASVEEVSDHAAAMMLMLARGINRLDAAVRAGRWSYTEAKPLYRIRGRTLGLLSFGLIPQTLARKMASFGLDIIAYDPYANVAAAERLGVKLVDAETLYRQSDILSLHVPLTDSTRGMVGAAQLALMKPTAILINTARGPVIDEDALIKALQDQKIAAAGLDVFETEPLAAGHPFTRMSNVVLSPHSAWYSEQSEFELRTKTTQNVVDVMQGRLPTYHVNRDVTPRFKPVVK
jgi:D-3-phosphoglycerate dehydrogenase / 2-oxoglutarate reductase